MEEHVMIRLSPRASIVAEETRIGVTLPECEIWAKDGVQAALLGAIRTQSKTVNEMKRTAHAARDGPDDESSDALALLDFIVTFGDAIEDGQSRSTPVPHGDEP